MYHKNVSNNGKSQNWQTRTITALTKKMYLWSIDLNVTIYYVSGMYPEISMNYNVTVGTLDM